MITRLLFAGLCLLVVLVTSARDAGAQGQLGTAITYQGSLAQSGSPADAPQDFEFTLFDAVSEGTEVGNPILLEDVPVTNGLFTVRLDFGDVFDGTALWLRIGVRPADSTDSFTRLTPRQELTAAPYALHSRDAWNLTGNAATSPGIDFFGTTDSQPLVFKTNNVEAMRLDANGNLSVGSPGTSAKFEASGLTTGGIAVMGTSDTRAVIGRLGLGVSCPGTFGVGGCAGTTGGTGVLGSSDSGIGVHGTSNTGRAVVGFSTSGIGVLGDSTVRGVIGTLNRTSCAGAYAVGGCSGGAVAAGVYAQSNTVALLANIESPGSNIFIGTSGGTRVARIDNTGRGFFNGGTQSSGADVAEFIAASDDPGPGDVVEIDPRHPGHFRRASRANSTAVAGVISSDPGVSLNAHDGASAAVTGPQLALVGRVPVKTSAENGPIRPGDLLVAASIPGYAMRGSANPAPGTVIGKALAALDDGTGTTEMLVMLR